MLDIKVSDYLKNAIFHKAAGWVEYYHFEGSNKPWYPTPCLHFLSKYCMLLCWISKFLTTWRMRYSTRLQAEWNITILRVVINLDIQHSRSATFVYYVHATKLICTYIQNCVRDFKAETMHSSKTILRYQQRKAMVTVQTWLVPACIPEWRAACEWSVGKSWWRQACVFVSKCSATKHNPFTLEQQRLTNM